MNWMVLHCVKYLFWKVHSSFCLTSSEIIRIGNLFGGGGGVCREETHCKTNNFEVDKLIDLEWVCICYYWRLGLLQ